MKRTITCVLAAAAAFALISTPANASKLSQLGKSIAYPAQKAVHNAGNNVSHPVKSVTGPINQAGQTTTRTLHKVTQAP